MRASRGAGPVEWNAMSLGQAPVDENWLRERTQQLLDELADADELEFLRAQYDAGLAWVQFNEVCSSPPSGSPTTTGWAESAKDGGWR